MTKLKTKKDIKKMYDLIKKHNFKENKFLEFKIINNRLNTITKQGDNNFTVCFGWNYYSNLKIENVLQEIKKQFLIANVANLFLKPIY